MLKYRLSFESSLLREFITAAQLLRGPYPRTSSVTQEMTRWWPGTSALPFDGISISSVSFAVYVFPSGFAAAHKDEAVQRICV